MTQHLKPNGNLAPLACPACEACGKGTRFVGLESHSDGHSDICTYECEACGNVQIALLALPAAPANGTSQARRVV